MRILIGKIIALVLLVVLLLGLFSKGVVGLKADSYKVEITDYKPWSEEVVELAASLPVQEGGRIKPLETRANFAMLQMRGDRRMTILGEGGDKIRIGPVEWMLDLFFRPEMAAQLPSFRVDNSEVLKALGIEFEDRKKRDRYSFAELEPHLPLLVEKAKGHQELLSRGAKLNPVEKQTLELANVLQSYFYLAHYFDFVREGIVLRSGVGDGKKVKMSVVLATLPQIAEAIRSAQTKGGIPPHVEELLAQINQSIINAKFSFHPLPPTDASDEKWSSVGELIENTITGEVADPKQALLDVQRLEELYEAYREGEESFAINLESFREAMMKRGGEEAQASVSRELSYNRAEWFKKALYVFGLGSLILILYFFMSTGVKGAFLNCLLYTSPSPRDQRGSRMPSSA